MGFLPATYKDLKMEKVVSFTAPEKKRIQSEWREHMGEAAWYEGGPGGCFCRLMTEAIAKLKLERGRLCLTNVEGGC